MGMKPVFVDLEKEYAEKQVYYDQEKKVTVERKGDKQALEDKITKLKRDIKRLQMPQEKQLLMTRSNDKITEKTGNLMRDVADIEDKISQAATTVNRLSKQLIELKSALISNYKKDLEMDGLYARVDLGILSDITEMHQTTEQRQERVADIRSQLEEQISNMENFIFRVGSPAPTPKPPTAQPKQLPHYSVVPDIKPPWRPVNRRGQPWTS